VGNRLNRIRFPTVAAVVSTLVVASLAGAKPSSEPVPDRVGVRGSEFDLILSKGKVAPGRVIVQFVNAGEDPHDLQLQRLGPGGTQVGPQFGAGIVIPGSYDNLDVHLKKGSRYVLWCSLPEHRARGMEATLKVGKRG
jgi:plastocyanin